MKAKLIIGLSGAAVIASIFIWQSRSRPPPQKNVKVSDYIEGMETPHP